MADSQSCREGPSILFSGREEIRRGQSLRSKGPRADVGFLGMGTGQLAPSPSPMGDLGNAVSSPSEVWVEPRLLKGLFIAFWRHQMASPGTCWRRSSGGHSPLNPPMRLAAGTTVYTIATGRARLAPLRRLQPPRFLSAALRGSPP